MVREALPMKSGTTIPALVGTRDYPVDAEEAMFLLFSMIERSYGKHAEAIADQ